MAPKPPASLIRHISDTEPTRDLGPVPTVPGMRGFTGVASAAGVGPFVGCVGSASDRKAARMGVELHTALHRGTPVAKALLQARLLTNNDDAESPGTSELLNVVSGYPGLALV